MKPLLEINNLNVDIQQKHIINNLNLTVNRNEIHVIMGPNGSGKSTLSKVLAGHDSCKIISGKIKYKNRSILKRAPELRVRDRLFVSFQNPIEIPGLNIKAFLKAQIKNKSQHLIKNFESKLTRLCKELKIQEDTLKRDFNAGFSGGEKKKIEILQMLLLDPQLVILDELDSGLDIDSLKLLCKQINKWYNKQKSLIIITHHVNILKYLKPTHVYVYIHGEIVKTGTIRLANKIEKIGYSKFL